VVVGPPRLIANVIVFRFVTLRDFWVGTGLSQEGLDESGASQESLESPPTINAGCAALDGDQGDAEETAEIRGE